MAGGVYKGKRKELPLMQPKRQNIRRVCKVVVCESSQGLRDPKGHYPDVVKTFEAALVNFKIEPASEVCPPPDHALPLGWITFAVPRFGSESPGQEPHGVLRGEGHVVQEEHVVERGLSTSLG